MAAPSYTEDLTDIDLAESTTGYFAIGGGGAGLGTGADLSMQGNLCVDKQITSANKGQGFDNGAGITLGANDHVWVWVFMATPGLTDTIQNEGVTVFVGSATNAYCKYHVAGNDTYGAAGRVARCYPIDYSVRTASAVPPYRTLTGSPAANPQVFGCSANTTAAVKGANLGLDAQRYGTGAYLTAGELISAGDASDNPCTFAGFNTQNDAIANRWGILTNIGGSYELQGRFVIGQNNAGTPTLARFQDSDVAIAIADTIHSATDFTQIVVDHASTVCNLTNLTLTALGTHNKGLFSVTSANPTVNLTGGTWTGLGTTTLRSNTTVTGLTWRNCDAITLNSATLTGCLIDDSAATSAIVATSLEDMTDCEFVSGGTGHAINLGTIAASTTMNWDNIDSGYTAASSGNETILVSVNSGQTLTINVLAGASTPSVYNTGLGSVNVVSGQVTLKVIVLKPDGTPLTTQDANVLVEAAAGGSLAVGTDIIKGFTDTNGEISDTRSYASNQPVTGWVRKGSGTPYYKQGNITGTVDSGTGLTVTVQMVLDE